jgi:hypothetical protein
MAFAQGLVAIAAAYFLIACQSTRVDGIPVYGKLQNVSRADIQEAINASGPIDKPQEIEVVSSSEMHAYYSTRELGWTPVRHVPTLEYRDRKNALAWTPSELNLARAPQVLGVLRSAKEVYVFRVPDPFAPPRHDDMHLRRLEPHARDELVRLIGHQRNWYPQGYHLVGPDHVPADVGFLFRGSGSEVFLFFVSGVVQGTFNGRYFNGWLGDADEELERWKRHYAQPELGGKRSNQAIQVTATRSTFTFFHD